MPNNISPLDVGSEIRHLHNRLARIENSPQVGHQSILDGSLDILDSQGRVLLVLGNQPDGTVGLASYDPVTGTKLAQLGQQAGGGPFGLTIRNPITGLNQLVAGTTSQVATAAATTFSTTPVTFADDPHVTVVVGGSGEAMVTFGATIGTGGDGDQGTCTLTVDGNPTAATDRISVSCSGAGVGVQNTAERTTIVAGLAPGSHTFSLQYKCANGTHGVTFTTRYVSVSPW